jgi:hypothetical protein
MIPAAPRPHGSRSLALLTPRLVPPLVQIRVLFGGVLNQIGWLLFGFGMIFVWVFAANIDWSFVQFRGPLDTAPGAVTESRPTGSSENRRQIHEIHYTFMTPDEHTHQGVCYSLGLPMSAGEKVTVEYPAGRPETSRIKGMRTGMFGAFVLFVAIFPAVALVLVAIGLRSGRRGLRLLKHGQLAEGRLIDKRSTNMKVNNQTVWKYTFSFVAADGREYQAIGRSHTDRLEDEPAESLLYDPANPTRSVMLGSLPGDPRIDEQGQIRVRAPLASLAVLVLPLIAIVGHGLVLLRHIR